MPGPVAAIPSLAELSALASGPALQDRAFAASLLQLKHDLAADDVAALHGQIRAAATHAHAERRARIRRGDFDRAALLNELAAIPLELRDHWVEELLGIAYPPLGLRQLPQELVSYSPSGLSEVLFVLDHAALGPGRTLVDLGSGLGKVVLLCALLTGADAVGIELDAALVSGAREAARELGLERASFVEGDLRQAPLPDADVFYMFIPLQRSAPLLERLEPIARRRPLALFAQGIDLKQAPWLRKTGAASYWLERFESHEPP